MSKILTRLSRNFSLACSEKAFNEKGSKPTNQKHLQEQQRFLGGSTVLPKSTCSSLSNQIHKDLQDSSTFACLGSLSST